ncbi:replication factor A protein, partial [Trifolium medium]|nr:replication factor A protein [Trifolium medium]
MEGIASSNRLSKIRWKFQSIDIFTPRYNTGYLVDVVGILSGVGVQREYERKEVKTKMLAIELDYD